VFGEIVATHMGASRESLSRVFPGYNAGTTPGVIRA